MSVSDFTLGDTAYWVPTDMIVQKEAHSQRDIMNA